MTTPPFLFYMPMYVNDHVSVSAASILFSFPISDYRLVLELTVDGYFRRIYSTTAGGCHSTPVQSSVFSLQCSDSIVPAVEHAEPSQSGFHLLGGGKLPP